MGAHQKVPEARPGKVYPRLAIGALISEAAPNYVASDSPLGSLGQVPAVLLPIGPLRRESVEP